MAEARGFVTSSGREIQQRYTRDDIRAFDYGRDLGDPGQYPYTRGLVGAEDGGGLWIMEGSAGPGTPEQANRRCREWIAGGGTGLEVVFDLPTRMGRDPDHPHAEGEVGRRGVSVASVGDLEALFDGVDLHQIATSLAIESPAAPVVFALFLVAAERRGANWVSLPGTTHHDVLADLVVGRASSVPAKSSMVSATDATRFCVAALPAWSPTAVCGHRMRDAGATAAQELAFALAAGVEYLRWSAEAGLDVVACATRLPFSFSAHHDFFEEMAKYRAARRMWARIMRNRFSVADGPGTGLSVHARTCGAAPSTGQSQDDVVRTALQALAAVLGGARSVHIDVQGPDRFPGAGVDPILALRAQQVLAHETGVARTLDALGGSWFVERLTFDLERDALRELEAIDGLGGMMAAIEAGYAQNEIAASVRRLRQEFRDGRRSLVGVDADAIASAHAPDPGTVDPGLGPARSEQVRAMRVRRDSVRTGRALDGLRATVAGGGSRMEALVECARADATLGEMREILREV